MLKAVLALGFTRLGVKGMQLESLDMVLTNPLSTEEVLELKETNKMPEKSYKEGVNS